VTTARDASSRAVDGDAADGQGLVTRAQVLEPQSRT